MTADETTQDENDFNEVRSKRKRFRKQAQIPITNVRPMVVSLIQGHHKYSLQEQSDRTFLW